MYYDCNPSHWRQFDYEINIMIVLCYVLNIVALIYFDEFASRTVKATQLYTFIHWQAEDFYKKKVKKKKVKKKGV